MMRLYCLHRQYERITLETNVSPDIFVRLLHVTCLPLSQHCHKTWDEMFTR